MLLPLPGMMQLQNDTLALARRGSLTPPTDLNPKIYINGSFDDYYSINV